MNGQIQAQYLQHINKKSEQGFTLTELVVVFFIIGILSAIALPSLLRCTLKIGEGKNYIYYVNRKQQAYFDENKKFATSLKELHIDLKTETENYVHSIIVTEKTAFHYAIPKKDKNHLKTYVGGVFLSTDTKVEGQADNNETLTQAIFCETNDLSSTSAANASAQNNVLVCDEEYEKRSKIK